MVDQAFAEEDVIIAPHRRLPLEDETSIVLEGQIGFRSEDA